MAGQETINSSNSYNYIIYSKDHPLNPQINILGSFDDKQMNELIAELHNIVIKLPKKPIYEMSTKIKSPYDIEDKERPVLDIIINSNGGFTMILKGIYTILNLAKARGAIIRTNVIGAARSCGSLLAIAGTPGFRIMGEDTTHLIHWGGAALSAKSDEELKVRSCTVKREKEQMRNKYKKYTNIPESKLKKCMENDGIEIDAKTCLEWGICDWIISEKGFISR